MQNYEFFRNQIIGYVIIRVLLVVRLDRQWDTAEVLPDSKFQVSPKCTKNLTLMWSNPGKNPSVSSKLNATLGQSFLRSVRLNFKLILDHDYHF